MLYAPDTKSFSLASNNAITFKLFNITQNFFMCRVHCKDPWHVQIKSGLKVLQHTFSNDEIFSSQNITVRENHNEFDLCFHKEVTRINQMDIATVTPL